MGSQGLTDPSRGDGLANLPEIYRANAALADIYRDAEKQRALDLLADPEIRQALREALKDE